MMVMQSDSIKTVKMMKRSAAMVLIMGVAACAPPPPPPRPTPPPVVVAPAPAPMAMPTPPNSAAPTLNIPAADATGRRMTLNVGHGPEQSLWQMRIALNVAALNCRGPNEAALVANYTRFLNANNAANSRAERWVIADQGRRNGTNGIAARDALSTRLYNYFAQPPVLADFCRTATSVMALAAAEPTAMIMPFAAARLPELDQPFVNFYDAYDRYRSDLAAWRLRNP
ncbi:MAG: hypothetical protein ABL909_04930 [Sphingopyxis sp.]